MQGIEVMKMTQPTGQIFYLVSRYDGKIYSECTEHNQNSRRRKQRQRGKRKVKKMMDFLLAPIRNYPRYPKLEDLILVKTIPMLEESLIK